FGLVHHLSAFAFSIFVFWIIGPYSIASQNYSATRRLLPFIVNLIFSFRAQYTRTLGEVKVIRNSPNALGDPQVFFSSSFQPFCSFLPSSVHALPQTPTT
ncbi:hypothetical protein MTR67_002162, partial [Solanum verrucosum]